MGFRGPGLDAGVLEFLTNGILVRSDNWNIVTTWQSDVLFDGRVVPQRIAIQAMGHDLLTADVIVEPYRQLESTLFDLPGEPAELGATLRPLLGSYVRNQLEPIHQESPVLPNGAEAPVAAESSSV